MTNQPARFSVVITSYNYKSFIEEAICSALSQTLQPAQIVIVDDGSTDGSAELLDEKYGKDCRLKIVHQPNGGQLSAFRRGLDHCTGEIVAFLDADDVWEPQHLENCAKVFQSRLDVDVVCCNLAFFGEKDGYWFNIKEEVEYGLTVLAVAFGRKWFGAPTSAITIRRKMACRALDLPEEMNSDWRIRADDCIVFGSSMCSANIWIIPSADVRYRMHGNNHWLGARNELVPVLQYLYRKERLLAFHRERLGLTVESLDYCTIEFKTRPSPTWEDLTFYIHLLGRSRMPLKLKTRQFFQMIKHYVVSR